MNADAYVVQVLDEVFRSLREKAAALSSTISAAGRCRCSDTRPATSRGRPTDRARAGGRLPLLGRMEGRANGLILRRDGTLVPTRAIVDGLAESLPPDRLRLRQHADRQIWLEVDGEGDDETLNRRTGVADLRVACRMTRSLPAQRSNVEKTDR